MDFPFTTDGCSGGMSAAWRTLFREPPPWEGACVRHDVAYWAGGTKVERRAADDVLWLEVTKAGHPIIAWAMWLAVRIGGHPRRKRGYRWAYGWYYERRRLYRPLDPRDFAARRRELRAHETSVTA